MTPDEIRALSDAALNDLAATTVMGWRVVHDASPLDRRYILAPGDAVYWESFCSDETAAFALVDALQARGQICLRLEYYFKDTGWCADIETDKGTPSHYRSLGEAWHVNRCRAITEACVMAASTKAPARGEGSHRQNKFCRPAGKLLHKMERARLVYSRFDGPAWLWQATMRAKGDEK